MFKTRHISVVKIISWPTKGRLEALCFSFLVSVCDVQTLKDLSCQAHQFGKC